MSQMRCYLCGKYGIYWKNLTINPVTYCPYCNRYNCHEFEIEKENQEEEND